MSADVCRARVIFEISTTGAFRRAIVIVPASCALLTLIVVGAGLAVDVVRIARWSEATESQPVFTSLVRGGIASGPGSAWILVSSTIAEACHHVIGIALTLDNLPDFSSGEPETRHASAGVA